MTNYDSILENEQTLDPENWEEQRKLAHSMVDDMFDYLQNIGQEPAWRPIPDTVKATYSQALPQNPSSLEAIYEDFKTNILPYNKGNVHPRFFSWVQGTGTAMGMMADMLASGMNPNVAIGEHAAMYIDKQVIEWTKQMMGFPESASGMLLSGGTLANITAIMVARNSFGNHKAKGLYGTAQPLTLYCSTEVHNCIMKAAEAIGIGSENVRKVPVNSQYEMDLVALQDMITTDKAAGKMPFCVVGNAVTVNTGAIDDLAGISKIAKKENLWFHVDGAIGAVARAVPELQEKLKAIELADSVALDFHKWLYVNYEVGCVLIRDVTLHRAAFAQTASYLMSHERGLASGLDPLSNYGMELSRGFKALKIWMSLREHGMEKYNQLMQQNVAQAFYLGNLIQQSTHLELLAPVTANIVCFRFFDKTLSEPELNNLNKEILMQLQEQGIATPSYTLLHGKYAIRVANVNHRSRKKDFEILVEGVEILGKRILC